MMTIARVSAAAALAAFFVLGACKHNEPQSQATTTAGTPSGVNESAVNSIAMARCDREELCDKVGSGRKYPTRTSCMDDLRDKGRQDLQSSNCTSGIDNAQLDKCLAEIRGERCGNALDTISRLNACRSGALCPGK